EDIHWADLATLDFIATLCRRTTAAPLLLISSFRPNDLRADGHPLVQITSDMILHKRATEIALAPLSQQAIGELLAGGPVSPPAPPWFTEFISSRCGGNPLFMRAMLENLEQH